MSLHVAIYTDDPDRGGVATYNHQIALGLVQAGYRVTLIQSPSTSPATRAQAAAGVAHEWISYDTVVGFPRTLADSSDAYRVLARIRPDVVVFSDSCVMANLAAKHVARHRGLPWVIIVHFAAPYLAERYARQLPIARAHLAHASAVIAVSSDTLATTRRWFGLPDERGRVIFNSARPALFAPRDRARAAQLRQAHAIRDDAVVSLTSARLTEVKGHVLQLDALAELRARRSRDAARLVCVWAGDGELRAPLEAEIAARGLAAHVRVVGQQADIAGWLDAADLFTLTSFVEGMPISILEAMAKAVPVIATAISGVPEQLGETGALLPDPQREPAHIGPQLAAIWAAWIADATLRQQVGRAGHARARTVFREDVMLAQVRAVLDEVAAVTTRDE